MKYQIYRVNLTVFVEGCMVLFRRHGLPIDQWTWGRNPAKLARHVSWPKGVLNIQGCGHVAVLNLSASHEGRKVESTSRWYGLQSYI